ncbi:MAG TPA: terminase family protein [Candidatus Glassbacteria bacterium]|nr:terminase family protein [Candidatus Glassbacteria bacterium]
MAATDLRSIIKSEYKKSAKDPSYFLRKYAVIQHPMRGKIHFNLFDYQEETLKIFEANDNTIVNKARQIGLSTLTAGYSLWLMMFHEDKNILVIATKQDVAKNLVTKVRVMHQNLPIWLRGECKEDNKLSLVFANGSQIKAIASSPDAGRSEALSLLIMDEAAHIDPPTLADDIWTAASSTLATGGKAIVISTPNGMGNFFHKTWVGAQEESNGFIPIFLDWKVHPDRDQVWRDNQTKKMGELEARQEHDADFIASGNTVVNGDLIQFYRQNFEEDPKWKRGFDNGIWVWESPDYGKDYLVVADVARGDSADKSAFHVIELKTVTQVCEYRGEIGTKEFGAMLVAISTEYNDALLVVENANVGWSVLQEIIDRGYKNLFYMEDDWRFVDDSLPQERKYKRKMIEKKMVPGFTTSVRTRPLIISRLDEYMRDNSVVIRSKRTFEELEVFIWNGSKAEAMQGYNDDLVMALSTGLWVRDTALKLRQYGIDITKLALDNFTHKTTYDSVYTPQSPLGYDPYQIPTGPGANQTENLEDIRWLIS